MTRFLPALAGGKNGGHAVLGRQGGDASRSPRPKAGESVAGSRFASSRFCPRRLSAPVPWPLPCRAVGRMVGPKAGLQRCDTVTPLTGHLAGNSSETGGRGSRKAQAPAAGADISGDRLQNTMAISPQGGRACRPAGHDTWPPRAPGQACDRIDAPVPGCQAISQASVSPSRARSSRRAAASSPTMNSSSCGGATDEEDSIACACPR